MFVMTKDI